MRSVVFTTFAISLGVAFTPLTTVAKETQFVVRRGPLPSWVAPLAMPNPSDETTTAITTTENRKTLNRGNYFRYLIHDEQERFVDGPPQSFVHLAYVVDKPSDVQYGSELEARFYPQFERLTVHFARIHRGGKSIDALKTAEIRLLNPESDRERFMYDEGKDVVVVLKDVRRGDAIEWAYTTEGENPALKGRVLAAPRLANNAAVKSSLFRLLVTTSSKVQYRLHGIVSVPRVVNREHVVEYRWAQSDVMAVEDEGDTPEWFVAEPWVEFSDFSSWADVAAWALPLYAEPKTLPVELEEQVKRWQKLGSDSEKLLMALRFVQEELRYLGMEIGSHSLKPHSPAQTFEQRFGDCKDKTLLLVTVLHRLGINAVPALVASREGRLLAERLPSPHAFDHVIAKVNLGDDVYWLDPTVTSERGDLRARRFSEYGYALPIASDTTRLEPLTREQLKQPLSEIDEQYELGNLQGPVTLTVNTRLRDSRADEFRSRYEQLTLRDLKRDYINFFAKRYDAIESLGDPTVVDDETNNVVTIQERYRISRVFNENELLLSAWSFDEWLSPPDIVLRKSPLGVGFPFIGQHRIVLSYDDAPDFELPDFDEQDSVLRFSAHGRIEADGHHVTVTYTLASLADAVPVEGVAAHLSLRRRLDARSTFRLERVNEKSPSEPAHNVRVSELIAAGVGVGLAALLLGAGRLLRYWQNRRRPMPVNLADSPGLDQVDDSSVSS